MIKVLLGLVSLFTIVNGEYLLSLKDAKVGECYQKVIVPAKFVTKKELIEVEKKSKDFNITEAKFEKATKQIVVSPRYIDVKSQKAEFKSVEKKILLKEKSIFFTLKGSNVPVSKAYIEFVTKEGAKLDGLKIGECLSEFVRYKEQKAKKEYISKQAYEIIDVVPPKFKIEKKKVLVKPAYKKIIKTPAIYETKVIKFLVTPESKEYVTKNGKVCIVKKPAVYKKITKRVMIKPPYTKVIKFPPTYKVLTIKKLIFEPIVTRRVISPKKSIYSFKDRLVDKFYWSKRALGKSEPTGLSICKKRREPKVASVKVLEVKKPATTIKKEVLAKKTDLVYEKIIKDANSTIVELPPLYDSVETDVKIEDSKLLWKKVECKKKSSKLK